jgi:hypothetical protein
MVLAHGDDPERSRLGWHGDAVDVEVQRVQWKHGWRFQWMLYHQARLIRSGSRRSHWGAELAGQAAAWWYLWSL